MKQTPDKIMPTKVEPDIYERDILDESLLKPIDWEVVRREYSTNPCLRSVNTMGLKIFQITHVGEPVKVKYATKFPKSNKAYKMAGELPTHAIKIPMKVQAVFWDGRVFFDDPKTVIISLTGNSYDFLCGLSYELFTRGLPQGKWVMFWRRALMCNWMGFMREDQWPFIKDLILPYEPREDFWKAKLKQNIHWVGSKAPYNRQNFEKFYNPNWKE